jgi:hypothetical protein
VPLEADDKLGIGPDDGFDDPVARPRNGDERRRDTVDGLVVERVDPEGAVDEEVAQDRVIADPDSMSCPTASAGKPNSCWRWMIGDAISDGMS